MNKIGLIIAIIVIALIGIFVFGGKKDTNKTTGNGGAGETTVAVTSSGFVPQAITIKAGTKVTWTNQAGAVATVDSAQHPTHLVYPPLNLGQFPDGSSVSLVFDKPGIYKYHNHLSPTQFGSVTVE